MTQANVTTSKVADFNKEVPRSSQPDAYRYKHVTTRLLMDDFHFNKAVAGPGDRTPEFDLPTTDGDRIRLADYIGVQPLLLVTGSITCPMTVSSIPSLKRLHRQFGDEVAFVTLNVREAHPGEDLEQPETFEEKLDHARALQARYRIPWTVAVDDVEGTLHRALDTKPNAAYLIGRDGTIVFRALWAGDERGLARALERVSHGEAPVTQESRALLGPLARGLGHFQDVLSRAGSRAHRDMLRAGPPIALVGRLAALFGALHPDRRALAALGAVGLLISAAAAALWLLG